MCFRIRIGIKTATAAAIGRGVPIKLPIAFAFLGKRVEDVGDPRYRVMIAIVRGSAKWKGCIGTGNVVGLGARKCHKMSVRKWEHLGS